MISVEVCNFQSIERVSFQIDGFTALVGRSNIGKSALIRAIRCALTGAPVAAFVRHGRSCARKLKKQKTCKCHVSVHLQSVDFDLLWEKGDSINRYVFNGAEYPAAERGMPDFLIATFNEVKVGDKNVLLQVSDQFNPIFLLDQSPGVVADVLSDMAKLDQVNLAMRMVEKDRREATATRKVREKDVIEATAQLASYDGLDTALRDVKTVKTKLGVVQATQAKVTQLDYFIDGRAALESRVASLEGVVAQAPPNPTELQEGQKTFSLLQRLCLQNATRRASLASLDGVSKIEIPSVTDLRTFAEVTFQLLEGWITRLRGFKESMGRLKDVKTLEMPSLASVHAAHKKHENLIDFAGDYEVTLRNIATLERGCSLVYLEEEVLNREWAELGVCSTCSRPFHSDSHLEQV